MNQPDWDIEKRGMMQEIARLQQEIKRLRKALTQIAIADYRGPRSAESQIAYETLKEQQ